SVAPMFTGREKPLLVSNGIFTRSMSPLPVPKKRSEKFSVAGGGPGGLMETLGGLLSPPQLAATAQTKKAATERRMGNLGGPSNQQRRDWQRRGRLRYGQMPGLTRSAGTRSAGGSPADPHST